MRRLVRRLAWSLAGLACFVILILGGCILFTRHALRHGALDQPAWSCIRAKDDPQNQILIDRSLAMQIQMSSKSNHTVPSLSWHGRGIAALIGLKLGYSVDERRAMALPTLSHTPVCQHPATH